MLRGKTGGLAAHIFRETSWVDIDRPKRCYAEACQVRSIRPDCKWCDTVFDIQGIGRVLWHFPNFIVFSKQVIGIVGL